MALLVVVGMLEGATPVAVLARFGLPDGATAVTGLLGHLAVSAVLGLVWGVLYGSLLGAGAAAGLAAGRRRMAWRSMRVRRSSSSARPGWPTLRRGSCWLRTRSMG